MKNCLRNHAVGKLQVFTINEVFTRKMNISTTVTMLALTGENNAEGARRKTSRFCTACLPKNRIANDPELCPWLKKKTAFAAPVSIL